MEASDTVMTLVQIATKRKDISFLEAQAEISFKAGIQVVVDLIKESDIFPPYENNDDTYLVPPSMLKVKLKEWGVE